MNTDRFKFRVWDEKCQEYIERDCNECSIRFDGRLVANVYVDNGWFGKYNYYGQADVIIESCTGIKDKNGNLIYENDRVKVQNATGTIRFGFYRKTAEHFPDSIYGYYIDWDKEILFRQDFGFWVTEDIEIIGNIHTTDKDK